MKTETLFASVLLAARLTPIGAIELDLNDPSSIQSAARTAADGMMSWYSGNVSGEYNIPGLLPGPYYWWEAGAMFGAMIDYWYYTGDSTYNDVVTEAMLFQVGDDDNYMPSNQSASLGNDDQAFWGMAGELVSQSMGVSVGLRLLHSFDGGRGEFSQSAQRPTPMACVGSGSLQLTISSLGQQLL